MFQGLAAAQANSTWIFSGGNWTLLHPASSPSPRTGESMVYDASDREVVLFGGQTLTGTYDNATWLFKEGNWTELNASRTHAPPGRVFPALTYDSVDRNVLLFGGMDAYWYSFNCYGQVFGDTWTFSAGVWTDVFVPIASSPSPRYAAALASNPADGRAVLFGGALYDCAHNSTVLYNDTWTFSGAAWTQTNTSVSPPARWAAGFCPDPVGPSLLLFGGWWGPNDTWRFTNGTWREITGQGPPIA
ncbi:MAG: hypothetical protein L3J87_01435, partial [Thermoplasmata archaeon]|nr:hypothetical protein [Thermoplasmata archaeon]